METKLNRKKIIWKIIKKQLKTRYLFILILLFLTNSVAWLIYAKEVSSGVTAHVRYWRVLLEAGDSPIVDYVDVNVSEMYPGMDTYSYALKAYNHSEIPATIRYTIMSINIMGDQIITEEGKDQLGEPLTGDELTSQELVYSLANDYPFRISMGLTNVEMEAGYGESTYDINVSWPFESGDDAADTYWGDRAYVFHESQSSMLPSISMRVRLFIIQSQVEDEESSSADEESSST